MQDGMFLTASHDKTVKLWDAKSGQPKLLGQNNLDVGAVFSAGFWSDSPFIVAVRAPVLTLPLMMLYGIFRWAARAES